MECNKLQGKLRIGLIFMSVRVYGPWWKGIQVLNVFITSLITADEIQNKTRLLIHSLQGKQRYHHLRILRAMEKLPLGERPFQANHERARCGKAQQSLRARLERRACWVLRTTRAAVWAEMLCSLPALSPRWGLCSGSTGVHLLVRCVCSGQQVGRICLWPPLHKDHGAVVAPASQSHPCCSCMKKRDHKESTKCFTSLWTFEANVCKESSQAGEKQNTQASARHRAARGKRCALTCSQWSLASSKYPTHSSLNTSQCSLNLFFKFC